ncbi:MAG: 30S ribosomal protein S4e [Methanosarcinaceae archaeon]|nr:30S ribosomal protein S4e [Methanosarcinaceae archaeon]
MHQKRMSMPTGRRVPKKTNKWVTATAPGPHNKKSSIPLILVIRDLLKVVDTAKEAVRVLSEGKILVDGKVRKSLKFPVGLFDVVSIPDEDRYYRVLQDSKGRLYLNPISKEDAKWKLCKVLNKTTVKGGLVQLNLNDGTNILGSNDYKTKDTLKLSVPEKEILEKYEYKIGNLVMITGGRHNGDVGRIKDIAIIRSSKNNMVLVTSENSGKEYETIENYVFVIGEDSPEIETQGE